MLCMIFSYLTYFLIFGFFFSSRRRHTRCALVTGVQTCALPIFCIAEPGWSIIAGEPQWPIAGGAHGYDNKDPEMLALFVASNAGLTGDVGIIDNIEVYPLLMRLIGVAPLANDATGVLLQRPAK